MNSYDVVGNDTYKINENRVVVRKDGEMLDLPESEDSIIISLYGYNRSVEKEWLFWLSFFKLDLPIKFRKHVFDFEFKDIGGPKYNIKDPKVVIFKEPVYIDGDKKFRLIPRFPKYAIKFDGTMYNIKHNKYNKLRCVNKKYYPLVSIVDQANIVVSKTLAAHRIVALTWIKNNDYVKYPLVDHIDGDKTNCHYTNLRWVSNSGNNTAAVETGLRKDNYIVLLRNIDTGEVTEHHSLNAASEYIGRSRINTGHTPLAYNKIWRGSNGKFEIKKKSDPRPWYFIDKDIKQTTYDYYLITIVNEDNTIVRYNSLGKFKKDELGYNASTSLKKATEVFKNKYPKRSISVDVVRDKTLGGVEARNINTFEVFNAKTAKEMSELIPLSKSSIIKYLHKGDEYQINGYQIRKPSKLRWCENPISVTKNKPKPVKIVNLTTKETLTFDSLRQCGEYLNIDKYTVKSLIKNNITYKFKNNKIKVMYIGPV